jgi:hypothetical protein
MPIPVPRYSTLTDVVQRLESNEVSFPSDKQLWAALLAAVPTSPGAQDPPLYLLEDTTTGESFTANQHFVRDFIERFEDERTHVVTLTFPAGLRTFRAGQRFWDFLVACHDQLALDPVAKEASELKVGQLNVTSNLLPDVSLVLSRVAWAQIVETWNSRNGPKTGQTEWSLGPTPGTSSKVRGVETDADGLPMATRPRSAAVLDPMTTVDDLDLAALMRGPKDGGGKGRYWQRFMKHWHVLQAEYRNYL